MKRNWSVLLLLISALLLSLPLAHGQESDALLEDTVTDHLSSPEEVRWYRFEMAEDGDAVIAAAGLQDHWDGYAYHWHCTIYRDDLETALADEDVRGFSEQDGPSILAAPGLAAGTYYVQMTSTAYVNPLLASFTSDSYELRLFRYYRSTSAAYDGEGIQTFAHGGDLLWAVDGTAFLKLNDGECFMALMKNQNLAVVPVLISTDQHAVEYVAAGTGEKITARGPFHHEDSGIDYYYSDSEAVKGYTSKKHSLPVVEVESASMLADKLLEAEIGRWSYWWMQYKEIVGACGAIGFLVLLWILFRLLFGSGSGGGGGSDSDGDASGSLYEAVVEDRIDGI